MPAPPLRREDFPVDRDRRAFAGPIGVMALIRSHDALFRFVFGEPEQMAELLRGELPESVAAGVEWNTCVASTRPSSTSSCRPGSRPAVRGPRAAGLDLLLYVLAEHNPFADQLRLRFGELPAAAVARLDEADAERLQLWGRRVLTAPTLDDVFAPA